MPSSIRISNANKLGTRPHTLVAYAKWGPHVVVLGSARSLEKLLAELSAKSLEFGSR